MRRGGAVSMPLCRGDLRLQELAGILVEAGISLGVTAGGGVAVDGDL